MTTIKKIKKSLVPIVCEYIPYLFSVIFSFRFLFVFHYSARSPYFSFLCIHFITIPVGYEEKNGSFTFHRLKKLSKNADGIYPRKLYSWFEKEFVHPERVLCPSRRQKVVTFPPQCCCCWELWWYSKLWSKQMRRSITKMNLVGLKQEV